jgi:hypothetical protein
MTFYDFYPDGKRHYPQGIQWYGATVNFFAGFMILFFAGGLAEEHARKRDALSRGAAPQ